jgi:hypothetical protein
METSFDTNCQEEDATPPLTAQGICSYLVLMDFENLGGVWQAGGRLYMRCAKPRRDGLKSARPCGEQHELDVRTMLWARGKAFPISMLSSRMRCPKCGSREATVRLTLPGSVLAAAARVR